MQLVEPIQSTKQLQYKELSIVPRHLTVEELKSVAVPIEVRDGFLYVERSSRAKLKNPVKVPLDKILALREKGLAEYILKAFASSRPKLIPFVLDNQSLIRLARHFLRGYSGSVMSLYAYSNDVNIYSRFLGHSPDAILNDAKGGANIADAVRVQAHVGFLEDYLSRLQDDGLSPGRVHGAIKHIRTWYRTNGVEVNLGEQLKHPVVYKDHSPKPEELAKLLDIATLREKVIISILALSGPREDELSKWTYRHVRHDLERNILPIHVHVEAAIVKGKYHAHDTFIGGEGAEFLSLYLEQRRKGSLDGKVPPEDLTDESPLIRDETSRVPRPIGPKAIAKLVRNLYKKTGLIKEPNGRMYDVRVHTLRKYFKTNMKHAGVEGSFADYFMGRTPDVYTQIDSLGVEKLRNIYASAGLSIRPRTKKSEIEAIKAVIRAYGRDPDQILTKEALSERATSYTSLDDMSRGHVGILQRTLREIFDDQVQRLATEK